MHIKIGFDIAFNLPVPTPMLLMLYTHPSRQQDLLQPEALWISPGVNIDTFYDAFGNRAARIVAPAGPLSIRNEAIVRDSGFPELVPEDWVVQHRVEDLPADVLPFLLASRYCEVDRLTDIAWQLFGHTPPGQARVRAVLNWVHAHVQFGYSFARPTKTALDVYTEGRGVCRDFQHLAITLLRALTIPARYATGYLGDIGVPAVPDPMDFAAWMQVYLGGQWWTCDARHNRPRIGRVLMATGRDAVDVALTTSFGPSTLTKFFVVTDEVTI